MDKSIIERIDSTNHVPKEKLTLFPPFPTSVKVELTSRCNFKCLYCATNRSSRQKGDMDWGFFKKLIIDLKHIGIEEVGLFLLGESFILNNIDRYIRFCKDSGIKYVFITTNGSLCTPTKLKNCINAGLDSIKFSVNAHNKELYKKLHCVDKFDDVIENIKWLYEYKKKRKLVLPRTCISSIVLPGNEKESELFKQEMQKYVDEFYFLPPYNQAGHIPGFSGKIVGNPGRLENMVPPVPCWALFNAAKVTWDGKLTACCFDHDSRFEIADLNNTSLEDAWSNSKFVSLRMRHLKNELKDSLCSKCLGLSNE